ncbi:hypothetical protein [Methanooceanicella nereidis]|uniref:hypothetical protein n=1 Tax=Methanooceanicella nereidis TaxID=2052831 RepID=UPI001E2CC399|nr:hypothetical protein [Methanocella sp. CWC-04]
MKFESSNRNFKRIPDRQGLYHIKPVDRNILSYIGETTELKTRLRTLCLKILEPEMPFNDPHTAAPGHWAWKDAENMEFECSYVPNPYMNRADQRGLECYLLWQYRLETGESTLLNHGRFHPNYIKSGNRSSNRRGGRIQGNNVNPSSGPSHPPLIIHSKPIDKDWMRLEWSDMEQLSSENARKVPASYGLYKLIDTDIEDVVYIGQSRYFNARLYTHSQKLIDESRMAFSYYKFENPIPQHQLLEMENDLIGAYYSENKKSPRYQFLNITSFE